MIGRSYPDIESKALTGVTRDVQPRPTHALPHKSRPSEPKQKQLEPVERPEDKGDFNKRLTEEYWKEYREAAGYNNKTAIAAAIKKNDMMKLYDMPVMNHLNRLSFSMQFMYNKYFLHKTNVITTVFRAQCNGSISIYAMLFSEIPLGSPHEVVHKYYTVGGSLMSNDGEYRPRMIPHEYLKTCEEYFSEAFEIAEERLAGKLNSESLVLSLESYFPYDNLYPEYKFRDSIDNARIAIRLYTVCWLIDYFNIAVNQSPNHLNPAYKSIIYDPTDNKTYLKIYSKLDYKGYFDMAWKLSRYLPNITKSTSLYRYPTCGIKLFPMTLFEAIKTEDIKFATWRELYVANGCSNITMNLICPSFPFSVMHFYIQNANSNLFDNPAMHKKHKQSEVAEAISRHLREADKLNYSDEQRTTLLDGKFARMSRHIQRAMIYGDSYIKLTDITLVVVSENIGHTMLDCPKDIVESGDVIYDTMFSDMEVFNGILFGYIYGFYCMNTKIYAMHGDPHMNNITVFIAYRVRQVLTLLKSRGIVPRLGYIIGDSVYIFNHIGVYGGIIDFSRAILGSSEAVINDFGRHFADMYFKEQQYRIRALLYQHLPNLMNKYSNQISALISNNFPAVFRIITALDTFHMCQSLHVVLTRESHIVRGLLKVNPEVVKLVSKIANWAENFVVDSLQKLINGIIKSEEEIDWPNATIIKLFFEDHRYTADSPDEALQTAEIFTYENPMRYEIEDRETRSPLINNGISKRLREELGMPPNEENANVDQFWRQDESIRLEALLSKYEQQESDIVRFEPWMFL